MNSVVKSIRSKLYQLKVSKHLLPNDLKRRLIVSLILPQLDYCCVALTDITSQHNLKLQRALNACVRFACNAKWDEHITPYYRRMRWLGTEARRHYFVACQLYRILNTKQPQILFNCLNYRTAESSRARAARNLLSLQLCRTEMYKRSFNFTASKLWNSLPPHIREAESISIFKYRMYEHLLN